MANAGNADAVAAPLRAALPWRGFLIDGLLAAVLLVGLSVLLIVPLVMLHMAGLAAAGKPTGAVPDLRAILPAVSAAAITAMLLTAGLTWWLRGRKLGAMPVYMARPPSQAAMPASDGVGSCSSANATDVSTSPAAAWPARAKRRSSTCRIRSSSANGPTTTTSDHASQGAARSRAVTGSALVGSTAAPDCASSQAKDCATTWMAMPASSANA